MANDRPDHESESVKEVGESGERKESIDESATVRASSDDDGGDRGGRLYRGFGGFGEEEGERRE